MGDLRRFVGWRPGLVARFALASLVAFVALGVALSFMSSRQLVERQEDVAQFHAAFVGNSVLKYALNARDFDRPATGQRYREIDQFVRNRILDDTVLRVKLWNLNGVIVYSDEPRLIGKRFKGDPDIEEDGEPVSEVTDLEDEENVYERPLASKLFATYVPLDVPGGKPRGPDGVVELYQDYQAIQHEIDRLSRTRLLTLAGGLVVLYVVLLPIALRASRTLRRQNDQLEEQAKRLSTLLAREQATVVELRRLNQMQSDFVAVASHELRSPLTAILGYIKTLRRPEFEGDSTARQEFLAAIERQGHRLLRLVTNLLTARQLENREGAGEFTEFDFATLAQEVKEGFHYSTERIRLELPRELPLILSDRVRVGEILANLVDNALKYSPDEAVVEVGADAPGRVLRFWVSDYGVGIPAPDLERVFDRFYQSDQSATRRFGGVGLGLHVVKQLVEALGGKISVESAPAVGSTFTVTLPVKPLRGRMDALREALQETPAPAHS